MASKRVFVFDEYRLDEQERALLRGTEAVSLPPKLFDLLAELVRSSGRLLYKHELLDRVWSDTAVEEGSLTRAVSSLRRVLGVTPDGREYIQTVAKQGYRFISPVRPAELEHTAAAAPRLPPALSSPALVDFVGRESELEQMQHVWTRAQQGRHQLLLVAGEPGIGKTRLSFEFARACAAEGATVLVGCCDEETLVPYQPFVESLAWYVRHSPDADLRTDLAAIGGGAELGGFVPDLRSRVPDLPIPPTVDAEGQRYRLFEAIAALLAVVSRTRPLLLVLDDIHWADKPTLLLLRHVIRSARLGAYAIVATYRESELGRAHPLAEVLSLLRRDPAVTRIVLRGLDIVHVKALVGSIAGPVAPSHLSKTILDSTDGNPFFATEMLHHLKETGTIDATSIVVSEGIKEVIGRRLSRLGDACNRVLIVASVIGREFDVAILEAVVDLPDNEMLDALEDATRAQLIIESREVNGRYSFTHALIRETLYTELSSPRRLKLHRGVADAIERLSQNTRNPPLAELAYHFSQALSTAGAVDKAIDYGIRAGDRATEALAFEEAARLFEIALQSLELKAAGRDTEALGVDLHARRARSFDALGQWSLEVGELEAALSHLDSHASERRCELLLALARAWFLLLDLRPIERYAAEALQLADRLQRNDLAANAIAWLARCRQAKGDLATTIDMDRDALARAPGVATAAHMLGPLTLYLAGRSAEGIPLAIEAADAARSSGDTTFTMYALTHVGLNMCAAGRYAEALEAFREVRNFGRRYGALPMLARATAMAAGLHLTLFDFDSAQALQSEAQELAKTVAFTPPIVSAGIDSLLMFARQHQPGRAERLLDETTAAAALTGGWHGWLWQLRLTQARAELAVARDAYDDAILEASSAIEQSRGRSRPKYEALGLMTRARALHARERTREAIDDAKAAVTIAERIGDPALLLLALDALIGIDGTDQLLNQARAVSDRIARALPDEAMRRCFTEFEVVRRIGRNENATASGPPGGAS